MLPDPEFGSSRLPENHLPMKITGESCRVRTRDGGTGPVEQRQQQPRSPAARWSDRARGGGSSVGGGRQDEPRHRGRAGAERKDRGSPLEQHLREAGSLLTRRGRGLRPARRTRLAATRSNRVVAERPGWPRDAWARRGKASHSRRPVRMGSSADVQPDRVAYRTAANYWRGTQRRDGGAPILEACTGGPAVRRNRPTHPNGRRRGA